jgi:hypothetical protein
MATDLQKISEQTSLVVRHDTTRIDLVFGEHKELCLIKVESQYTGGLLMLNAHYCSLGFGSKPNEYWEKKVSEDGKLSQFQMDVAKWVYKAGVRDLPDKITQDELQETLILEYPNDNEKSLEKAIRMNFKGQKWETIQAFNLMNCVFVSQILSKYQKELSDVNRIAIKERNRLRKLESEAELDPIEAADKTIRLVGESFVKYKENYNEGIIGLCSVEYDVLKARKCLLLSDDEVRCYFKKAEDYYVTMFDGSMLSIITNIENKKDAIIKIAKRLAVADYYATIKSLEL